MTSRKSTIKRKTAETDIAMTLNLDGKGKASITTGVGFFDHMLTLFAKHGLFDLSIEATGDIHVDAHHTVEDIGICIGQAMVEALGDKKGINRFGFFYLPMEEALAQISLDFSGRPWLEWRAKLPGEKCGDFDTGLGREFARALVASAGLTLHVDLLAGEDAHHCLEAIFKGLGRSLKTAVSHDPRGRGGLNLMGKM
jgi:Imidazoleglycerol-phosphate dehydratase